MKVKMSFLNGVVVGILILSAAFLVFRVVNASHVTPRESLTAPVRSGALVENQKLPSGMDAIHMAIDGGECPKEGGFGIISPLRCETKSVSPKK